MRGIYILSGKPTARVEKGVWLDSQGRTLGFDLWLEVAKNQWIPATALSDQEFAAVKDQLQIGIYDAQTNRVYTHLEPTNVAHKLVAMREGLQAALLKGFIKEDPSTFKAQILDPLANLALQVEELQRRLAETEKLESEADLTRLDALELRTEKLERAIEELEKEQREKEPSISPENVEMHHLDFLTDIVRAWQGRALSTESLELLCRAQHISEYASLSENNALLLDPQRMKILRELLVSK